MRMTGPALPSYAATEAVGPWLQERLSRLDDGRYAYRTKRGPTLVLTAGDLVRQLLALIPPRGQHLTCFHGLFAPNAKLRGALMKAPAEPEKSGPPLGTLANAKPKQSHRPPRVDWVTLQRRTFGSDVWECPAADSITSARGTTACGPALGPLLAPAPDGPPGRHGRAA